MLAWVPLVLALALVGAGCWYGFLASRRAARDVEGELAASRGRSWFECRWRVGPTAIFWWAWAMGAGGILGAPRELGAG